MVWDAGARENPAFGVAWSGLSSLRNMGPSCFIPRNINLHPRGPCYLGLGRRLEGKFEWSLGTLPALRRKICIWVVGGGCLWKGIGVLVVCVCSY